MTGIRHEEPKEQSQPSHRSQHAESEAMKRQNNDKEESSPAKSQQEEVKSMQH